MPKSYYPGQKPPDETTLEDIADEISTLKNMLENALGAIASLQESVKELKEQVVQLPGEIERY